MIDYKRIYQAKVRDMSYQGVRVSDELSTQGKRLADKLTEATLSFIRGYKSLSIEEQKTFVQDCRNYGMPFTASVAERIIRG
jgi:hypothetical protein